MKNDIADTEIGRLNIQNAVEVPFFYSASRSGRCHMRCPEQTLDFGHSLRIVSIIGYDERARFFVVKAVLFKRLRSGGILSGESLR